MLKKHTKHIVLATLVFQLLAWMPSILAQEVQPDKRKLLVTAYYSPLPDQSFYIRGSYEADVKLNGKGTHGADGTGVYMGMLAAPQTYPFGTRVNIPGLGVGEVHDRGGAIFATEGFDRIDVWMGKGEEGLSRALNWGSRFVEGSLYSDSSQGTAGFDYSWLNPSLSPATVSQLQANTAKKTEDEKYKEMASEKPENEASNPVKLEPKPSIHPSSEISKTSEVDKFAVQPGIGKGERSENVKNLQQALKEIGYFQADLTGIFDSTTEDAVFKLQNEGGILHNRSDQGAGYFGPKTHQALQNLVNKKVKIIKEVPKEVPKKVPVGVPAKQALPQISSLSVAQDQPVRKELGFEAFSLNKKVVQSETEFTPKSSEELKINDQGEQVLQLQRALIEQKYLAVGLDTGYFGQKTLEAVVKLQLEKGIVPSKIDAKAGIVGPKTLTALQIS